MRWGYWEAPIVRIIEMMAAPLDRSGLGSADGRRITPETAIARNEGYDPGSISEEPPDPAVIEEVVDRDGSTESDGPLRSIRLREEDDGDGEQSHFEAEPDSAGNGRWRLAAVLGHANGRPEGPGEQRDTDREHDPEDPRMTCPPPVGKRPEGGNLEEESEPQVAPVDPHTLLQPTQSSKPRS